MPHLHLTILEPCPICELGADGPCPACNARGLVDYDDRPAAGELRAAA